MNPFRVNNPILNIEWLGWKSDTLTLQRNGWQLSIQEQPEYWNRMRIAIHHPTIKLYGISEHFNLGSYRDPHRRLEYHLEEFQVKINQVACDFYVRTVDTLSNFRPFNAEPEFIESEIKSIKDMNIFSPIRNPEHKIVIPEYTTDELLYQILKLQDPKQQEIRENKRREIQKFMKESTGIETGRIPEKSFAEILIGG